MTEKQVITGYVDPSGKGEGNWSAEQSAPWTEAGRRLEYYAENVQRTIHPFPRQPTSPHVCKEPEACDLILEIPAHVRAIEQEAARSLPEPQALDDRLRYHPLTGDADFEEASLSDRLDVLIGHAESVGFHRGYAAALPGRPEPSLNAPPHERCGYLLACPCWTEGATAGQRDGGAA